jgi:hypothetical protein
VSVEARLAGGRRVSPRYDYWLFDDEVRVMRYDHAGRFVAIEVDDDPPVVAEHRQAAQTRILIYFPGIILGLVQATACAREIL